MKRIFAKGGQIIGVSASASVLPMNFQGYFPLRLTGLIALLSTRLSRSSPAARFESINSVALSLLYGPILTSTHDYWKNHRYDYTDLCQQSDVAARFVIVFLSKSKHLLITWLQSPPTVILEPKKIKSVTASIFSPCICYDMMEPDTMILDF